MKILAGLLFMIISYSSYAASCASLGQDNTIILNSVPVGECTGYVILTAGDWVGSSVWALPSIDEITLVWSAAFILPTTLFLIAWAIGRVLNLFK